MVSVFDFDDYRAYIQAYVEEKKAHNSGYSYRFIAQKLTCNPGFFNRVVRGERNLSGDYLFGLISLFGLKGRERLYFELLVQYNQSKKSTEREHLYSRLKEFKGSRVRELSQSEYALYDEWYNVALREVLNTFDISDTSIETCRELGRHFVPPVRGEFIQSSLESLLRLGFILKGDRGCYKLKDKLISSGVTIPPEVVKRVLTQFFQLGVQSLDRFHFDERLCSAVTVSISKDGYKKIEEKLAQVRREILAIAKEDTDVEDVYHMNFQLFPITKKRRSQ